MTGPGTINPNFMDATHGVGESVSIKGEARAPNPELGNVTKPSAWALAGRVFLGIISIGFSELIRINSRYYRKPLDIVYKTVFLRR